jgi:hypothetical protein
VPVGALYLTPHHLAVDLGHMAHLTIGLKSITLFICSHFKRMERLENGGNRLISIFLQIFDRGVSI